MTVHLCNCVSVVVGVDAELNERLVDHVGETEDVIVSQWIEVSADEKHHLRERFNEILRPLGFETSLVVIRRANSLALIFLCMTLSALMSLRDQWRTKRLRDIVRELFAFLSHTSGVHVNRLTWPLTDYERCLEFFSFLKGKRSIMS